MRPWIGRKFAHHRRTKRGLNQWVGCHRIQRRGFVLARVFQSLLRRASRGYAVGFLRCPFGTRGSQVQILSPRPTQRSDLFRVFRGGRTFSLSHFGSLGHRWDMPRPGGTGMACRRSRPSGDTRSVRTSLRAKLAEGDELHRSDPLRVRDLASPAGKSALVRGRDPRGGAQARAGSARVSEMPPVLPGRPGGTVDPGVQAAHTSNLT
jgi:hypothetical protein